MLSVIYDTGVFLAGKGPNPCTANIHKGLKRAKILWDMEKFYDSLDICKLIDRANYLGYPSKLIAMGMTMHMAPRVIRA